MFIGFSSISDTVVAEEENLPIYGHARATGAFKRFGEAEFNSGKAVYDRTCLVCHGNLKQAAINETVRRFHESPLQNGARLTDIYETLTKGYKNMAPQPSLTARQKYEVIYYIREAFFKEHNPSQYVSLGQSYYEKLWSSPENNVRFPWHPNETSTARPDNFEKMDHGPVMFGHFEVNTNNIVPKGVIIGLDPEAESAASSKHNVLYDLDTGRLAAIWSGGPVTWTDLVYSGQHSQNMRVSGDVLFESPSGLNWTKRHVVTPGKHIDFRDPRTQGMDGRTYGPLPKDHLKYQGLFLTGDRPSLYFKVNGIDVIETPWLTNTTGINYYVRTIQVAPRDFPLYSRVYGKIETIATKVFSSNKAKLLGDGNINDGILVVEPSKEYQTIHVVTTDFKNIEQLSGLKLEEINHQGAPLTLTWEWPKLPDGTQRSFLSKNYDTLEKLDLVVSPGPKDKELVIDEYQIPQHDKNPWNTRIRPTGIDFLDEDTAALASWSGDVFIVTNILERKDEPVRLSRIASGLHQPLGLVVKDGEIFVSCRDQIMRPHDLDGDGEADYYEAFNTDHIVTMHFHDFSAGLDADEEGNLYYVKCSQHQIPAIHERHGTLIKVSPDGEQSEIIAHGLRSNNGCFVDDDGSIWLTDQEGYWNPQNKIFKVTPGAFHGNMLGWHDAEKVSAADSDMVEPMVWTSKSFSNSPSEVFRFPAKGWGALNSKLGYYGYGRGYLMLLAEEEKSLGLQGFTHQLGSQHFPTGIMRGKFHPLDQSLFAAGMSSWGSNRYQVGGLFRVRPGKAPYYALTQISSAPGSLVLQLSDEILKDELKPAHFSLKSYTAERSAAYGSSLKDEKIIEVKECGVSEDGRTIHLTVPDLHSSRIVILKVTLPTPQGKVEREMHGSLYSLE